MKDTLLVFKPSIARQLLKLGYTIVDIKAHNENPERTVFVFKIENNLMEDFNKLSNK
jgi:hypothetical protein